MYKFVIRTIEGFQGTRYFDTHKDALEAAALLSNLSNHTWYVTAIKVG